MNIILILKYFARASRELINVHVPVDLLMNNNTCTCTICQKHHRHVLRTNCSLRTATAVIAAKYSLNKLPETGGAVPIIRDKSIVYSHINLTRYLYVIQDRLSFHKQFELYSKQSNLFLYCLPKLEVELLFNFP